MTTRGYLDGHVLLGSKPEAWTSSVGVEPVTMEFDVTPASLEQLYASGGISVPRTLRIEGGAQPGEFRQIYVINQGVAENPQLKRIVIADRRWLWKSPHVLRRYNLRRRVGFKRRGEWQEELQQDVVPEIQYREFSLHPQTGEPWKAHEILRDILTAGDALGIPDDQVVFEADIEALEVPIDRLELNDPGNKALARALAFVQGVNVTVDPDGRVRAFSTLTRAEQKIVGLGSPQAPGAAGHEIVGGGHVEFVDRRWLRPQRCRIYFQILAELRADFLGDGTAVSRGTVVDGAEDIPILLENVLPCPDFKLTLADGTVVYLGTWITIQQALDAWNLLGAQGLISKLTADVINKAFIPGTGFWAALDLLGKLDALGADADWSARIGALMTHYRQTYRLRSDWRDRILTMHDYLVATIDVLNGQRAPAMAFADHAIKGSRKALLREVLNGGDAYFGFNVDGYPGENAEITDSTKPSPARVHILDDDQGILRIEYQVNPYGTEDAVLPSKVENMPMKGWRRSQAHSPAGWDMSSVFGDKVPKLAASQKAAVLFSAVPAAPNSKLQFYAIDVEPKEIASILPAGARANLSLAKGPTREIFVGPGIETARIRWKQSEAATIKKIFGVGGRLDEPVKAANGGDPQPLSVREQLRDLCINDDTQDKIDPSLGAASLPNIAKAIAASIYAQEHGRVVGSMTSSMNGALKIVGAIKEIQHFIDTTGAVLTKVNLPPDIDPVSLFSFLDASTRNIVMRLPAVV